MEKNVSAAMTEEDVLRDYSGAALAYLGDGVMELLVRERFLKKGNMQAEKYHRNVTAVVNARSQAAAVEQLMDRLTEKEKDAYRRGRNASVHTRAKSATLGEYKKATGLEALFGFLYLTGQRARMDSLLDEIMGGSGESNEL